MQYAYFLVRYIPFWAVPMLMISCQFAYIYWLKSLKKIAAVFITFGFICFSLIVFYFYHGGGERVVYYVQGIFY